MNPELPGSCSPETKNLIVDLLRIKEPERSDGSGSLVEMGTKAMKDFGKPFTTGVKTEDLTRSLREVITKIRDKGVSEDDVLEEVYRIFDE